MLTADEARQLLDSIDTATLIGLRDKALIGVMVYSFARVSAALGMRVEDYYLEGRRAWFRLHEKGGKRHEVPAHHNADAYLHAYIEAAGIAGEKKSPLFRSAAGKTQKLTDRPMDPNDALRMIKRRAKAIGLSEAVCNHTFRATGITAFRATAARWSRPRRSPTTPAPRPPSSTTAAATRSRSTWSKESSSIDSNYLENPSIFFPTATGLAVYLSILWLAVNSPLFGTDS